MSWTAYFCSTDAPWIGGQGIFGLVFAPPANGNFTASITGTLTGGGSYSNTQALTVNTSGPTPLYGYGKVLFPGNYTCVITEVATSITQTYNFTISEYPEDLNFVCQPNQGACSGDGSITFGFSGGELASVEYCVHSSAVSWIPNGNCNLGAGLQTVLKGVPVTLGPLSPGTYNITLYIENECTFNVPGYPSGYAVWSAWTTVPCNFTINSPSQIPLNVVPTYVNPICDTDSGIITIDITNSNGPFTYSWTGPGGFTSTDENIYSLYPGTYTVDVTDLSTGCTGTTSVTLVSVPDVNGCGGPITCFRVENCNPDCFGSSTYYLVDSNLAPLVGYVINGLEIEGEVINPNDCWTVYESLPIDSNPPVLPCYNDLDIGNPISPPTYPTGAPLIDCSITVDGNPIYTGPAGTVLSPLANTAAFVTNILTYGNISDPFETSAGLNATSFNICSTDLAYSGSTVTVSYKWYDTAAKAWVSASYTVLLSIGVPGTGCYTANTFIGYSTAFSNCVNCQPEECPTEPTYESIIPNPVKIFYQIRESACDIKAVKQFATAYSNMLKKLKYGVSDCCNGLNIGETWLNKQISDLQETVIPGYNCREVSMQGCSWLPLQGCEILDTPMGTGTSIIGRAGEDLTYAKLVMLSPDGLLYLNQPTNPANYQRAVGFSMAGVSINQTVRVLITGIITDPSWSLITGAIYYASPNGGITTIVPTIGISQMVGIATDSRTLLVELKQPNIL